MSKFFSTLKYSTVTEAENSKKMSYAICRDKPIIFNYLERVVMLILVNFSRVHRPPLQKLTTNFDNAVKAKKKKSKCYFWVKMPVTG